MAHPRPGNRIADRLAGRLADHRADAATETSDLGPALEPAGPQRSQAKPDGEAEIDVEIEAYLAVIATRLANGGLAGPRRARHAIIAELRDGLLEATTAHPEQGLHPKQAVRAALEEFGDPWPPAPASPDARHKGVHVVEGARGGGSVVSLQVSTYGRFLAPTRVGCEDGTRWFGLGEQDGGCWLRLRDR